MSKRVQVTLSDRRVEQVAALSKQRGMPESMLCRLMLLDGIDLMMQRVKLDNPAWRETFDEIERRYNFDIEGTREHRPSQGE